MMASSYYINDQRFSRTFELPADPANGRTRSFKVEYADFDYRNESHPQQENVFLFFGSLLGSRLVHIAKDEVAKKHKIRIINPDRPGIGGTDAADAEHRMSLWLEVIPALLGHLGIQHVSLGCHSGGTTYALDMMLHHPQFLHPEKPYLAIGGPWILPSHTGVKVLSIAQLLPASVINNVHKLAKLVNNHIGPIIGASLGLSQALMAKLIPASPKGDDEGTDREGMDREGARFEEELWPKVLERIYAEGIEGISPDAVLLMKKVDGKAGWSDWGDYDTFVPLLAESLRASGKRLRVDVFFAANDIVIGDEGSKGPLWFDQCWDVLHCSDVIDYHSTTTKGADHNTIWNLRWGAIQRVFERIGQPVGVFVQ